MPYFQSILTARGRKAARVWPQATRAYKSLLFFFSSP
jgi:hypothetical protein